MMVEIYIDGASRGNPGPAGIGFVVLDKKNKGESEFCKYIGETTNNIAEYVALVYALQTALLSNLKEVRIKSDSELLVNQLNGKYKVKNSFLRIFFEQFLHLKSGFQVLAVEQIPRQENQKADLLANRAIDERFDSSLKKIE
jgi:ribonuclease HI